MSKFFALAAMCLIVCFSAWSHPAQYTDARGEVTLSVHTENENEHTHAYIIFKYPDTNNRDIVQIVDELTKSYTPTFDTEVGKHSHTCSTTGESFEHRHTYLHGGLGGAERKVLNSNAYDPGHSHGDLFPSCPPPTPPDDPVDPPDNAVVTPPNNPTSTISDYIRRQHSHDGDQTYHSHGGGDMEHSHDDNARDTQPTVQSPPNIVISDTDVVTIEDGVVTVTDEHGTVTVVEITKLPTEAVVVLKEAAVVVDDYAHINITHVEVHHNPYYLVVYVLNDSKRFNSMRGMLFVLETESGEVKHQIGLPSNRFFTYQYPSRKHHPEFVNDEGVHANNRFIMGSRKYMKTNGKPESGTRFKLAWSGWYDRIHGVARYDPDGEANVIKIVKGDDVVAVYPEPAVEEPVSAAPALVKPKMTTTWGAMKR